MKTIDETIEEALGIPSTRSRSKKRKKRRKKKSEDFLFF